jgi:hypothetical protein
MPEVRPYNEAMDTGSASNRFEFTPQQVELLQNQAGQVLHVPVEATNKVYLLVEEGQLPALDDEYVRRGLSHAAVQAAEGNEAEWSVEEVKRAGRELLAQRNHRD